MPQHASGRFFAFTHHRQAADAFAVQREDFRERITYQAWQTGRSHSADGIGIIGNSTAKTLIGDIKERDQFTFGNHFDHFIPLGMGQVRAGRVMAARVQQRDAVLRQLFQCAQHGVKLHAQAFAVEVGIGIDLEAGTAKDGDVVFPGRIADPHLRIREIAFQEVGTDLQRAGTAHGLNGGDTLLLQHRVLGTKQQMLNGSTVRLQAFHRQVH
ncbi:hypothetical protein D3C79_543360 [compost metagenome]